MLKNPRAQLPLTQALELLPKEIDGELMCPVCVSQEQYDFCYRVVQDFVDIFSDYANFK